MIKKSTLFLCGVLGLLFCFGNSDRPFAECEEPISITIGSATIPVGESGTTSIDTGPIDRECDVIAFNVEVVYDPAIVIITDITSTEILDGWTIFYNDNEPGRVLVQAFNSTEITGEGTLLEFIWTGLHAGITVLDVDFYYNEHIPEVAFENNATIAVTTTDVETAEGVLHVPSVATLIQNFPNPFNPKTTILYSLADTQFVKLTIYDINGLVVQTLVEKSQPEGIYETQWNGTNMSGTLCSSGIYFCQLEINEIPVKIQKMVLLR